MIKILVLDDLPDKLMIINDFLVNECNININSIDQRSTIKEGRKILYENEYDLLILDLVMPRDEESEASSEESVKFLDEIYYNSQINIPIHIIGFSQYDEEIDSFRSDFEGKLWHLMNFSYTNNDWKDKLKNLVCHLISVKKSFKESVVLKFDIGIVCALDIPEFREVLNLPCNWKELNIEDQPVVYYEGNIDTINGNGYRIIACSVNNMGMQATATVTSAIIAQFGVKYMFMTGICAGIIERGLNFGDIVVAQNSTDYGSGKYVESNGEFIFKPEPHQYPTDQGLISKVKNFVRDDSELLKIQSLFKGKKNNSLLKVMVGPVASGSLVVASKSLIDSIANQNRKLLAVDMESHGLYLACHYSNKTKALLIKSVSDFGDNSKNDDYQEYAAFTSSRFLYSFIFNSM